MEPYGLHVCAIDSRGSTIRLVSVPRALMYNRHDQRCSGASFDRAVLVILSLCLILFMLVREGVQIDGVYSAMGVIGAWCTCITNKVDCPIYRDSLPI